MSKRRLLWRYCLLGMIPVFTLKQAQAHDMPALESSHIELLCSEQGVIKYRLFTNKVLRYENGDCAYPEGIYIEFYESTNKIVSVIGSANSVYFIAEKNIYSFRGDVELKNLRDMKQLNTEELHWSPEQEVFYTDKFVRIETETGMLTAKGLTAKQDLSHYTVFKPQGRLSVE